MGGGSLELESLFCAQKSFGLFGYVYRSSGQRRQGPRLLKLSLIELPSQEIVLNLLLYRQSVWLVENQIFPIVAVSCLLQGRNPAGQRFTVVELCFERGHHFGARSHIADASRKHLTLLLVALIINSWTGWAASWTELPVYAL